jgi:prophage tail gpP-like protein
MRSDSVRANDRGSTVADDVALIVGGKRYSGWKSIRVTLSIESLCGSFALEVSDRWSGDVDPWPIAEGDACRVEINGQVVIDGYVDDREPGGDATTRTLAITGRDRAADLVDCSLLVPDASTKGSKWTYRNLDIAQFARQVATPHGIKVSVQPGLVLPKDPYLVAHPGETGFEAIKRAAGSAGVLVVSDGAGGIVITRSGTARASGLIEGFNIKSARAKYSSADRFHTYLISSQPPGTDEASGEDLRVQATATDLGVTRTNRVIVIRPDKGMNTAAARRRADWEARIRAAKAATATITVQGWTQQGGELWTPNALVYVSASKLIGIKGDMLISQVEYTIGEGGTLTQISIVRPDAFTPEPQTAIVGGEGAWKELATGAL